MFYILKTALQTLFTLNLINLCNPLALPRQSKPVVVLHGLESSIEKMVPLWNSSWFMVAHGFHSHGDGP